MVAATVERPEADRATQDVRCPCGRFLTQARRFAAIPPGVAWTRIKCAGCNRWRWVDLGTGLVADAPIRPGLVD